MGDFMRHSAGLKVGWALPTLAYRLFSAGIIMGDFMRRLADLKVGWALPTLVYRLFSAGIIMGDFVRRLAGLKVGWALPTLRWDLQLLSRFKRFLLFRRWLLLLIRPHQRRLFGLL